MLNVVSSAAIGFFAKASCDMVPKISWRSNSFKLSFWIASFKPASNDNGQRPFVTVTCGDKKKKTELGTWSQEQGEWQFREAITLEVSPEEEITISASCSQQYDLVLAAVELASNLIGEVCFPVSSVLPKLKAEDRDVDGLMHATPVMGFDLLNKGARTGRVYVSMETRHPPSQRNGSIGDRTCFNAIADKDRSEALGAGPGPTPREQMHREGAASERANSERYRQPSSRGSPWG